MSRYLYLIVVLCLVFLSNCSPSDQTEAISKENVQLIEPNKNQRYQFVYDSIQADQKIEALDELVYANFMQHGFNGCLLIYQKGVFLHRSCYGYTCLKCKDKDTINYNTRFQLASLSKTFTAVAILKLMEDNKLKLEDTIQKFIPEFPYPNITIKLLLSHRSGLPYYVYAFEKKQRSTSKFPINEDVLKWFKKDKPHVYNYPNRHFSYNNTNYMVLATIIERVSGVSYGEYIRKQICEPLKMRNTYVVNSMPVYDNVTVGHEGKAEVKRSFFDHVEGDKGVYSTLKDLYLWYKALNSEQILKKETLDKAFSPQSFEHKGHRNYGLGFRMVLDEDLNPKHIYHNGWWKGYNTVFWFSPKSESLIIILTNVKNKSIYRIKPIVEALEGSENSLTDEEVE